MRRLFAVSFDDMVGIHDNISRNCIDIRGGAQSNTGTVEREKENEVGRESRFVPQLVVTHVRNEIFSYVPVRRPRYPNRIGMTRSSVGLRGRIDQYRRGVCHIREYQPAKITNTEMQFP